MLLVPVLTCEIGIYPSLKVRTKLIPILL